MCHAQGHNIVTPVRLELPNLQSGDKHSTTELQFSQIDTYFIHIYYDGIQVNFHSGHNQYKIIMGIIYISFTVECLTVSPYMRLETEGPLVRASRSDTAVTVLCP